MFLCAWVHFTLTGKANEPVGFCEVVVVTPSRTINHEIDLKGQFDEEVTETFLMGPQLFSHAVGFGGKTPVNEDTYLNWYKIEKPVAEPRRALYIRDPLRGNGRHQIVIGNAAFLLSPSQRVTSGPPNPIPAGLNPFKAYRIVGSNPGNWKARLTGSFGPKDRVATKAVFLCLPVEQWHHDEHFDIKNPNACMLVYELVPKEVNLKVSTIDQFGLNSLSVTSTKWVCLPTQVFSGASVAEGD
jgi:hypothetical protein